MKFVRCMSGYSSLHPRRNQDILVELEVHPVEDELAQHKQKWFNHFSRLEDIRYPKKNWTIDLWKDKCLD